jgi:nucleotide-binding universal stress UspA family protein
MKTLIGVDGSQASLDAVKLAGRLMNPASDRVAIYFSPTELEKRLFGKSRKVIEGAAAALFEESCKLLPDTVSNHAELICSSKPAAVGILESASGWHADLIVIGARGHSSTERLLLGSVSRAVVHAAHLPVLITRTPADDHDLTVMACHHMASEAAMIQTINAMSWPESAIAKVIGVTESMLAGPLPTWLEKRVRDPDTAAIADAWKQEHDDEVAALNQLLENFQKQLPEVFRKHAPLVEEGNPGEKILERVKKDHTDVLVTGRTPSDRLTRWLLGSTSEALLTHSHSSVLVVPVEKKQTH